MTRRDAALRGHSHSSTPPDRPGAVYLLPNLDHRRFKVGWSRRPLQRIQRLPEFAAQQLDLSAAQVAWFSQAYRAQEVERSLHRGLAPYSVELDHHDDGYTEWFDTQGLVLARRMLSLVPATDIGKRTARLQALAEAPDVPMPASQPPLPPEAGALDAWYRIEDLWLRLGAVLPLALHLEPTDRSRRCLLWLGLRRLVDPGSLLLRSRAVNLETYQWFEAGQSRSLVTLMEWEQDDLALHLIPDVQLQRWAEGDELADRLQEYLARRAIPLRKGAGR